jgi:hypothetical protein
MKTPMEYYRHHEQKGAIGYMVMWAMGVPAGLLFIIFLLRGCD